MQNLKTYLNWANSSSSYSLFFRLVKKHRLTSFGSPLTSLLLVIILRCNTDSLWTTFYGFFVFFLPFSSFFEFPFHPFFHFLCYIMINQELTLNTKLRKSVIYMSMSLVRQQTHKDLHSFLTSLLYTHACRVTKTSIHGYIMKTTPILRNPSLIGPNQKLWVCVWKRKKWIVVTEFPHLTTFLVWLCRITRDG